SGFRKRFLNDPRGARAEWYRRGEGAVRRLFALVVLALGLAVAHGQVSPASAPEHPARPTGIELVSSLGKPKAAHAPKETDYAGYLLIYFKDQTQSAYLAISQDGYTFTDVNGGQPVFDG